MEKKKIRFFDVVFWYAVLGVLLVVVNMLWCANFGDCFIDDSSHTHGEPFFSFLYK